MNLAHYGVGQIGWIREVRATRYGPLSGFCCCGKYATILLPLSRPYCLTDPHDASDGHGLLRIEPEMFGGGNGGGVAVPVGAAVGCGGSGGAAGTSAGAPSGRSAGADVANVFGDAASRGARSRSSNLTLSSSRSARLRSEIVITSATMAMTGKASATSTRMTIKSNIEAAPPKSSC